MVRVQRGRMLSSMGQTGKDGSTLLSIEETVLLVERGALEVLHPTSKLPLSLVEVRGLLCSMNRNTSKSTKTNSLTTPLASYNVFAHLRRLGYMIVRKRKPEDAQKKSPLSSDIKTKLQRSLPSRPQSNKSKRQRRKRDRPSEPTPSAHRPAAESRGWYPSLISFLQDSGDSGEIAGGSREIVKYPVVAEEEVVKEDEEAAKHTQLLQSLFTHLQAIGPTLHTFPSQPTPETNGRPPSDTFEVWGSRGGGGRRSPERSFRVMVADRGVRRGSSGSAELGEGSDIGSRGAIGVLVEVAGVMRREGSRDMMLALGGSSVPQYFRVRIPNGVNEQLSTTL